jgi:hypothetical protein
MHKKIIYRTVLILTLVLSSSCNKFLTLYPQNGTTRQAFWQNKEELQTAVIGIYASLLQGIPPPGVKAGGDVEIAMSLFLWGEVRADNVTFGPAINADELNLLNQNILSTNFYTQWTSFYRTINYCNTVLQYAPGVLAADPTLTQDKLNGYLAEALTVRALLYFDLVKTFGDVPLKLTPTASDSDLAQLAKTPQATILTQILADLKTAEGTAVLTYGDKASDKGRITKYTVEALEADIYLYQYDYANCITACDKIINSGQFGLVAGDSNFFNTLYANGNSNESIFEFQFDPSTVQNNPFYGMFGGVSTSQFNVQPNVPGGLSRLTLLMIMMWTSELQ